MSNKPNELYVIGAGQMRTGTKSLKLALEKLYNGKCYHMAEIFENHHDHVNLWISVFDNNGLDETTAKIILSDYCATVDFPSTAVYKDLMKLYPNAKVILTTRNSDEWLKSVRNTALKKKQNINFVGKIFLMFCGMGRFHEFSEKLTFYAYKTSYETVTKNDLILKQCYEDFNKEVRETVPKERLLEFNFKQGWKPLCEFLDLPIPDEPYPFTNSTEEFNKYSLKFFGANFIKFGILAAIFVGAISFAIKRNF